MGMKLIGAILIAALLQLVGAQSGYAQTQERILFATETGGTPSEPTFTSATDSGFGPVCGTANEDLTACFGTPYAVSSSLINPNFVANGGIVGVNLCDVLGPSCALDGRDPANTISDQLYLQVAPADPLAATNLLTWCWDSDLEPNVNICQDQITVPTGALSLVLEPAGGPINLTSFFTGPNGPLAAGAWQVIAMSEVPEPTSLILFGTGLIALARMRRRRKAV